MEVFVDNLIDWANHFTIIERIASFIHLNLIYININNTNYVDHIKASFYRVNLSNLLHLFRHDTSNVTGV